MMTANDRATANDLARECFRQMWTHVQNCAQCKAGTDEEAKPCEIAKKIEREFQNVIRGKKKSNAIALHSGNQNNS